MIKIPVFVVLFALTACAVNPYVVQDESREPLNAEVQLKECWGHDGDVWMGIGRLCNASGACEAHLASLGEVEPAKCDVTRWERYREGSSFVSCQVVRDCHEQISIMGAPGLGLANDDEYLALIVEEGMPAEDIREITSVVQGMRGLERCSEGFCEVTSGLKAYLERE